MTNLNLNKDYRPSSTHLPSHHIRIHCVIIIGKNEQNIELRREKIIEF